MAGGINRIVWNNPGFVGLMNSPEMVAFLDRAGQAMARSAESIAGGDAQFDVTTLPGKTRARSIVITGNKAAKEAEAQSRALTASIDAARSA